MLFYWFVLPFLVFASEKPDLSATIVKIEGGGSALIRKKTGAESKAKIGDPLTIGDSVVTDNSALASLLLSDGTILRVGHRTTFEVAQHREYGSISEWIFRLVTGAVRAVVEKSENQEFSKIQIQTKHASMGIRGTDFLLEEKDTNSQLFVLEGKVDFGDMQCAEKQSGCTPVTTGSSILPGAKPTNFSSLALFQSSEIGGDARSHLLLSEKDWQRLESVKKQLTAQTTDKFLSYSKETFLSQQDQYLGRNKEIRKKVHLAKENGTYSEYVFAADRVRDLMKGQGKENQSRKERLAWEKNLVGIDRTKWELKKFALAASLEDSGFFGKGEWRRYEQKENMAANTYIWNEWTMNVFDKNMGKTLVAKETYRPIGNPSSSQMGLVNSLAEGIAPPGAAPSPGAGGSAADIVGSTPVRDKFELAKSLAEERERKISEQLKTTGNTKNPKVVVIQSLLDGGAKGAWAELQKMEMDLQRHSP